MSRVFDVMYPSWHCVVLECRVTGCCFIFDPFGKRSIVISSEGASFNNDYSIFFEVCKAVSHYMDVRNGLFD